MKSFDDWFDENDVRILVERSTARFVYEAGAASKQDEIDDLIIQLADMKSRLNDNYTAGQTAMYKTKQIEINELQKRIDVYEKHITVIKHIHENEFNEDSDTSWILGNLDGFFECLNEDLKGNQND